MVVGNSAEASGVWLPDCPASYWDAGRERLNLFVWLCGVASVGLGRQAQATHPERWGSRPVKHWKVLREVILNQDNVK